MNSKVDTKRQPPKNELSLAVHVVDQWRTFWDDPYCSQCFYVHAVRAPTKRHLEKRPVIFEIAILTC